MKKVYETPAVEFELIETEDIMTASLEEDTDSSLNGIIDGGDIEIDL